MPQLGVSLAPPSTEEQQISITKEAVAESVPEKSLIKQFEEAVWRIQEVSRHFLTS